MGSNLWLWQRAQPTVRPRNADADGADHFDQDFLPVHLLILLPPTTCSGPARWKPVAIRAS